MKTKINFFIAVFLLSMTVTFQANSQISISNISEIPKVKNGTTYIAMKDPESEKAQAYVEVFKKYWTFSKIEFIKYSDIQKYAAPENSFITVDGNVKSVQSGSLNYDNTYIYLRLWTCDPEYFTSDKRKKKEFAFRDMIEIARMDLYPDFKTIANTDLLFQADYDGDGHLRNWGPGILKNQLQTLTDYLIKNEKKSIYSGIANSTELKKLTKEVLYVPEYVLIKFNKFSGDETKKHTESDIFGDYDLKYKIISIDELNQKIIDNEKPFYYMVYVKSSTDKYICVYNSATGELIYSNYSPMSYNIDAKDLKALFKEIKK